MTARTHRCVAIAHAGAVNDHGIVEQGVAIHIFGVLKLLQEPGELLDVPEIDFRDFLDFLLVIKMVR